MSSDSEWRPTIPAKFQLGMVCHLSGMVNGVLEWHGRRALSTKFTKPFFLLVFNVWRQQIELEYQ